HGGGQERRLRPGTLPVALIAAFGHAALLARENHAQRNDLCAKEKKRARNALRNLAYRENGDAAATVPWMMNLSFAGVDSEAAMVALKGTAAASNGAACTSNDYGYSHVLQAMALPDDRVRGAIRFSWSHLTGLVPWEQIAAQLEVLQSS
ncbi:MAG TPA: hypothetical protein VG897_15180, partial [Terriglobales bacterium]|nr:hypothetical protein [Terriglobales bacterium]